MPFYTVVREGNMYHRGHKFVGCGMLPCQCGGHGKFGRNKSAIFIKCTHCTKSTGLILQSHYDLTATAYKAWNSIATLTAEEYTERGKLNMVRKLKRREARLG